MENLLKMILSNDEATQDLACLLLFNGDNKGEVEGKIGEKFYKVNYENKSVAVKNFEAGLWAYRVLDGKSLRMTWRYSSAQFMIFDVTDPENTTVDGGDN